MSDTSEQASVTLELDAATRRVVGPVVPSRLQAITDAHMSGLMALVATMRDAGVNEDLVRHSVRALVASYEAELLDVMTAISREGQT